MIGSVELLKVQGAPKGFLRNDPGKNRDKLQLKPQRNTITGSLEYLSLFYYL